MADIFRKKSLDKLSSPEQLDKMITVSSPMTILALAGGGFIIIIALLWGIFGRVPITKEGNGILVRNGELTSVYAKTQGVITKTYVSSGDFVEKGDVLYEAVNATVEIEIADLKQRIDNVESVTFTSQQDIITRDNQPLLSIKNQQKTLSLENNANILTMTKLKEAYDEQKAQTQQLDQELQAAEDTYYSVLSSNNNASIEYQYQTASSAYQAAENAYQAAKSAYESAKSAYDTAKSKTESFKEKQKEAEELCEKLKDSQDPEEQAQAANYYEAALQYKENYEEAKKTTEDYKEKKEKAKKEMEKAKKERDKKKEKYDSKKKDYEDYVNSAGKDNSRNTKAANDYSNALSQYGTSKAKLESIEDEMDSLDVQLSSGSQAEEVKEDSLEEEFDSTKAAILDELNSNLKEYRTLMENLTIKSDVSGIVYSTFVSNGSAVTPDSEVIRVSPAEKEQEMEAVFYFPLDSGKKVRDGMKINIYPTTLAKEEYGHMTGTVVSVTDYVTSTADLYTRLGEGTLANKFSNVGPVMEVRCEIEKDASTKSGFAWSSKKGQSEELQEATLLSGSVIIENAAPITMLIPKLKEIFGIE